jgi:hypothetical protein
MEPPGTVLDLLWRRGNADPCLPETRGDVLPPLMQDLGLYVFFLSGFVHDKLRRLLCP